MRSIARLAALAGLALALACEARTPTDPHADALAWVGRYRRSSLGESLMLELRADGTFVYRPSSCWGEDVPRRGRAVVDGSRVRLSFEPDARVSRGEPDQLELTYVPWDQRAFLLSDDQLEPFCDAARASKHPIAGALEDIESTRGRLEGLPQMPEPHAAHIRDALALQASASRP